MEDICLQEVFDQQLIALKEKFPYEKWVAMQDVTSAVKLVRKWRFFISDSDLAGLSPETAETRRPYMCNSWLLRSSSVTTTARSLNLPYEAYVHDYMYGKAMEELAEGIFQLERFEIR